MDVMKDISEIKGYEDVVTWCRDFLSATDSTHNDIGVSPLLYRSERNLLMSLVSLIFDYFPAKDLTTDALLTILSMAETKPGDYGYTSPLDLMFYELETGKRYAAKPDREEPLSDCREISYPPTIPILSRYPPRSSGATATSHLSANTSHHRIEISPSDAGFPSNRSPERTSHSSSQI